jgi:hypothetical protein
MDHEKHISTDKPNRILLEWERKLADLEYIKKWTEYYMVEAQKYLEFIYGQENLSVIEKSKLRQIAEECVKQGLEEKILAIKKEMPANKMINVELEIVYRWLWELYDIKKTDIPGEPYGNEMYNVPEYFKEALRGLRGDSHLV